MKTDRGKEGETEEKGLKKEQKGKRGRKNP